MPFQTILICILCKNYLYLKDIAYLKALQANSKDKCYFDETTSWVDLQIRNPRKREGKDEDEARVVTPDRIRGHWLSTG